MSSGLEIKKTEIKTRVVDIGALRGLRIVKTFIYS